MSWKYQLVWGSQQDLLRRPVHAFQATVGTDQAAVTNAQIGDALMPQMDQVLHCLLGSQGMIKADGWPALDGFTQADHVFLFFLRFG